MSLNGADAKSLARMAASTTLKAQLEHIVDAEAESDEDKVMLRQQLNALVDMLSKPPEVYHFSIATPFHGMKMEFHSAYTTLEIAQMSANEMANNIGVTWEFHPHHNGHHWLSTNVKTGLLRIDQVMADKHWTPDYEGDY